MKRRARIMPMNGASTNQSIPVLGDLRNEQHVSERIVAEVTGLSLSWVRKQRFLKQGPLWKKIGKSVRYPVCGLREWLAGIQQQQGGSNV
ncbi:MAG: hypothetical protein ABSF97_16420 [Candidatus Sulfotelmatobacter sp.]|jgi:hypothetical protein